MLDFLNSLGKKMISQPERVSTDTYSDAITGQVKDTVVDYVENFPIADSEFYSKLGTGVVGSALSIPAEAVNIASYAPYSPFKVIRESGALKDFQKNSTVAFLKNQALKVSAALGNPDNPAFTTTGNVGERYAEGLASDVLVGGGFALGKKIPSAVQNLAERTENPILDMMDALAIAGTTRKTPLSQFGAMVNPTGIVRSEMAATPKRTLDENYFYNKAEDIAKNLTQEKGTSKQFLSMFEKAGVTKDEFKWSGLGKYLEEQNQAKQPITKEGVIDFLGENRMSVNIKELAKEVDYDNPQELRFRTSDSTSDSDNFSDFNLFRQYVEEQKDHTIERIREDLEFNFGSYESDILDQVYDVRLRRTFSNEEQSEIYLAHLKDYFAKTGEEFSYKDKSAFDYANVKTSRKINSRMNFWNDFRSVGIAEKNNPMPDEKAKELIGKWENFEKNIVGFAPSNLTVFANFRMIANPKLSEILGDYDSARDLTDTSHWQSLNEEYPELTAREAFSDPVELRDFARDVNKAIEEVADSEVEDMQIHEITAYDSNNNALYSAIGQEGLPYYSTNLDIQEIYDPNELRDAMYSNAVEQGDIGYGSAELYEELTPSDIFGTREAYNVNLYEDTSDLALNNMSEADVEMMETGGKSSIGLQSHFGEFADTDFPIGHVRSTIRDLGGEGREFEDEYLKIISEDAASEDFLQPDNFVNPDVIGRFAPRTIKSSNLDGRVYAIHEFQSDVAQKLTSSRSSEYTASGLEKKKNEVRKIIGKNPESKMMEFDDRAEAIREKGNEFVKNLNQWQQSTPSKLTQEDYTVRDFKKGMGHLETETHPEITDHLFRLLVERGSSKEYREIRDYLDFENKNEYQTSADTPYSLLREKEELAVELQNLEKDTRVYKDAQKRFYELERIEPNTIEAPYIQEKRDTTRIMLKGEIAKAVDADADYVTLGEPIFNRDRQSFKDAEEFYGVAVPRIAEKLLKPLDPDIKLVNMDVGTGEIVKGFKITEKLKKSLKEQGQSFFAPFAAIGAGILGNKVANEEERSYE